MLAEAIHSLADTTNQVFLLIGRKRSGKAADEVNPWDTARRKFLGIPCCRSVVFWWLFFHL